MRKTIAAFLAGVSVLLGSCGASVTTGYANQLIGADGQPLVLDELTQIANDPSLTIEQKRQAFRELGIEDEEVHGVLMNEIG